MRLSLSHLLEDTMAARSSGCYELLLRGARFADENGFSAVWMPERHFRRFGGSYPNPSVTGAAVAAITDRIHIRAGSVVLPLHDPITVAEEWSIVDNLSNGRVGVAVSAGSDAAEYILRPGAFADRWENLYRSVASLRHLWRGGSVARVDGSGDRCEVQVLPPPVTPELPLWLTCSGDIAAFRLAGEMGLNVLAHPHGQDLATLPDRIRAYRLACQSRRWAGHVTAMINTYVGTDLTEVHEVVRQPLSQRLSIGYHRLDNDDTAYPVDSRIETSGLFGTVDTVATAIRSLGAAGVDEVACVIDFGVNRDLVIDSLPRLAHVLALVAADPTDGQHSSTMEG